METQHTIKNMVSATKNKFEMTWQLTSNINWKLIKVFPKKLAFNLRHERTENYPDECVWDNYPRMKILRY